MNKRKPARRKALARLLDPEPVNEFGQGEYVNQPMTTVPGAPSCTVTLLGQGEYVDAPMSGLGTYIAGPWTPKLPK